MIEKITLLPSHSSKSQMEQFEAIAGGLRSRGVEVFIGAADDGANTQAVACWGWRKGQPLHLKGHDVLVFERAYLGDRFHWTSVAWNGLNGRADFCLDESLITPERFKKNFEMKPWNKDGKNIIIMGQLRGDMSLDGRDLTQFYNDLAKDLWQAHRKHVWFKPHPQGIGNGRNFEPTIPVWPDNLESALADAYLVVTFNSNSGVDAVVNGVPAISFDIASMAYAVTGHGIHDRLFPCRENWAHRLAHCQWSPDEINSGDYWERLCRPGSLTKR